MELAKMKAPEGATSCSVGDVLYTVKRGFIRVALEHVGILTPHGYVMADDQTEQEKIVAKLNV